MKLCFPAVTGLNIKDGPMIRDWCDRILGQFTGRSCPIGSTFLHSCFSDVAFIG